MGLDLLLVPWFAILMIGSSLAIFKEK